MIASHWKLALALLILVQLGRADESPTGALELRKQGLLGDAGKAFEQHATFDDQLGAVECYLRAGGREQALACLQRANMLKPGRSIVSCWSDWLRGRPIPVPSVAISECTAPELHLAGLLARISGSRHQETQYLLAAYRAQPKHPVYGADLWRALDGEKRGQLRVVTSAESILARAEEALRRGARADASTLLKSLASARSQDPRLNAVVALSSKGADDRDGSVPGAITAYLQRSKALPVKAVLAHSEETAKRKGILAAISEVIDDWEREGVTLLAEYLGTDQALSVRVQRARTYCDLSYLMPDDSLRELARSSLGELAVLLVAGVHSPDSEQAWGTLAETCKLVQVVSTYESVSQALLRRAVNPTARVLIQWHMARTLRLHGKTHEAIAVLQTLLAEKAWKRVESFRREDVEYELLRSRLQADSSQISPLRAQTLDGKVRDLRANAGKLRLLEFFSTNCGFCEDGAKVIKAWLQSHRPSPIDVVAVSTDHNGRGREQWAKLAGWPVLADDHAEAAICRLVGQRGTPFYCVIDEEGRIQRVASGTRDLRYLLDLLSRGALRGTKAATK